MGSYDLVWGLCIDLCKWEGWWFDCRKLFIWLALYDLLFPLSSVWGLDGIMPNDNVALMVACDDNAGLV